MTDSFPPQLSPEARSAAAKRAWETVRARAVPVSADNITFGVEIECALDDVALDENNISIGDYHHGHRLPHPFPTGWRAEHDSSIDVDGYTGLEIVSPILNGLDGLRQVVQVMQALNDTGAHTNHSCGVHVHIGARSVLQERAASYDMVAEWVRRLLCLVSHNELALYALAGNTSRVNNEYCESIKGRWQSKLKPAPNALRVRAQCASDSRYQSLNVTNLFAPMQTVEFRAFGSTLNPVKVIGYVLVAVGLCQRAASLPVAPRFDNQAHTPNRDSREALRQLHRALGWQKSARMRYGFPTDAWGEYGLAVLRNQNWNVNRFQAEWNPTVH